MPFLVNSSSRFHAGIKRHPPKKKNCDKNQWIPIELNLFLDVGLQGVMSESINWCELESQFFSSSVFRKKLAKMVNVVDGLDEAFMAGRHFVKNYDNTNRNLDNDLKLLANTINYSRLDGSIDDAQKIMPATDRITEIYRKIEELNIEINDPEQSQDDDANPEEIAKLKLEPIDTTKIKWWEREALQFMRGMMDECTHLKNFSVPYDTSLITAVCAKDDAYVPREVKKIVYSSRQKTTTFILIIDAKTIFLYLCRDAVALKISGPVPK